MDLPRDQRTSPTRTFGGPPSRREDGAGGAQPGWIGFGSAGADGRQSQWTDRGGSRALRNARAGRVAVCGCSVGAGGTARKPLAALGLGLTAALRVRAVRAVGAG